MSSEIAIRAARPTDSGAVINLFDTALLAFDRGRLRRAVGRGDVLLAIGGGRIRGAVGLDGSRILVIAVRPRYRRAGIGSALIDAAASRRNRLVATCDERHRAFYASNEFVITELDDGRLHGVREAT